MNTAIDNVPNTAGHAAWGCLAMAWICFLLPIPGLGLFIGWPLNLVAFILAIVAMSKRGMMGGLLQLLASLVASPIVYIIGWGIFAGAAQVAANNSHKTAEQQTSSTIQQPAETSAAEPTKTGGSQWSYDQDSDPMATGTAYFASVQSTNTVEFGFPYAGPQHGLLTLRSHPRHGKDVMFKIERGQIQCNSFQDCNILVRFDDQKAQTYSAVGAADNSTETIFIRNYSRFVSSMQKAKVVRISAEVFHEGTPVFEFDVTGFDESKYLPKKSTP